MIGFTKIKYLFLCNGVRRDQYGDPDFSRSHETYQAESYDPGYVFVCPKCGAQAETETTP